ncbi:COX assembly mitochondrial protein 2 homolog [Actinia tenebrosa]|uniref:COX assembly mitochondrial protein n=1 Tax=Actinia tenebrosa TaxID=6105 RepID=A0A6P8J2T9_ACTTE|nr:COX assembly mitochondrial protein 2 homolog [Actinia tenebrosa]
MHPLLAPHLHNKCLELIEMLNKCHDEHRFGKFLGKCNDIERNLQRCLKAESKERRQRNMEESKKRKEKFRKFCSET